MKTRDILPALENHVKGSNMLYKYLFLILLNLFYLWPSFAIASTVNHPFVSMKTPSKWDHVASLGISLDNKKLYIVPDIRDVEMRFVDLKRATVTKRFPGVWLDSFFIAPNGKIAYILFGNALDSLDLVTGVFTTKAYISGDGPHVTVTNQSGDRLYYATIYKRGVGIFDTQSNKMINLIENDDSKTRCEGHDYKSGFYDIAMAPNDKKIYLADPGNRSIATLDLTTDELKLHAIQTKHCPTDITIDRRANRLYVTSYNYDGWGIAEVIDTTTDTSIGSFHVGKYPHLVVTPDSKKVYSTSQNENRIIVTDARNFQVIKELTGFSSPWKGVSSKDSSKVYIVNAGDDDSVSIINTQTDTVEGTITTKKDH